jgi:hypothetical protein
MFEVCKIRIDLVQIYSDLKLCVNMLISNGIAKKNPFRTFLFMTKVEQTLQPSVLRNTNLFKAYPFIYKLVNVETSNHSG